MENEITVTSDLDLWHIDFIAETEKQNFSEPWSKNSILESLAHNTKFFVAQTGDTLLGYIGLNFVLDEGYITSIAVIEEYRKKGVATKLIKACFDFAKENKLSFVSLEVRTSNKAALSLYEKMGFSKEGIRKNFYSKPNEDAIIMTRRF